MEEKRINKYHQWKNENRKRGVPKKNLTKKKYMQYRRERRREKKHTIKFLRTIGLTWDML